MHANLCAANLGVLCEGGWISILALYVRQHGIHSVTVGVQETSEHDHHNARYLVHAHTYICHYPDICTSALVSYILEDKKCVLVPAQRALIVGDFHEVKLDALHGCI